MQYFIAALLPEPLRSELAQLRSELDRWTPRWLPPHVTIIRPFSAELTATDFAELSRPLSLTAQIVRWSVLRNPNNNFVTLEPTPKPFQVLRDALLERVPTLQKRDISVDPYGQYSEKPIFHITIAGNIPDAEVSQIFSKVNQKTYLQVFQIGELSVFSMESGGFWEKVEL